MEIFHQILNTAIGGGASDVHIKIGHAVIFRINRQLIAIECPFPTAEWMNKIVHAIVPPHALKRLEDEREVDFSYFAPGVGRFRTNLFQQKGEFCLAMRYVKTKVPSFEELGLLPVLRKIAESPRGIVLLSGSTGCGKSTTLAAMIEHINASFKKHIVTLEDPIEFVFEDNQSVVEQREVGLDTLSFEHGLKHILRQDPDIIMVGEMRDSTSFTAAMSAADTGHLVLSTLHTTTASQSITRILDFFKADEREQKTSPLSRKLLNFGHTIGHAIESKSQFKHFNHGEAVALGMAIETTISHKLGLISKNNLQTVLSMLEQYQFNLTLERDWVPDILELIKRDKKNSRLKISMALISEIGKAVVVDDIPRQIIRSSLAEFTAR